jgi:hypothetical protein
VIYIHKKGDRTSPNNYRGITLLNVVGKVINKVLATRLAAAADAHGLLHEAQNAFRPGRSCDDHVFALSQVLKGRNNRNQRTYAFFLSLHKAYDTIWRDGLLYVLWQKGVRGKLWHHIRVHLYSTSKRQVQHGQRRSKSFVVDMGCVFPLFETRGSAPSSPSRGMSQVRNPPGTNILVLTCSLGSSRCPRCADVPNVRH